MTPMQHALPLAHVNAHETTRVWLWLVQGDVEAVGVTPLQAKQNALHQVQQLHDRLIRDPEDPERESWQVWRAEVLQGRAISLTIGAGVDTAMALLHTLLRSTSETTTPLPQLVGLPSPTHEVPHVDA